MSLFSKILKFSSADPNFKQRCPPVFGDLQIFQISFSTSSFVSSLASCVVKVLIRKLVLQVTFCPIMISVSWATRLKTCNLKIPLLFLTLEELLQVFLAFFLNQKFHHIHYRKKKNFILDYLFWFLPETWTIFCELNHFCLLNIYHNSCRKRSWSRDRRCYECGNVFERKYNLNLHILNLLWKSPLVLNRRVKLWKMKLII